MSSDQVTESTRSHVSLGHPVVPASSSSPPPPHFVSPNTTTIATTAIPMVQQGTATLPPSPLLHVYLYPPPSLYPPPLYPSSSSSLLPSSLYTPQPPTCLSSRNMNDATLTAADMTHLLFQRPPMLLPHHAPNDTDRFASLSLILDEALDICKDMESIGMSQSSALLQGHLYNSTDDTNDDDEEEEDDDISSN